MASAVNKIVSRVVAHRARLPRWVNAIIDRTVAGKGALGRLAWFVVARGAGPVLPPPPVPDAPRRLYVGPTNYAGQGFLWARAVERELSGVAAVNMAVAVEHGFDFASDEDVPAALYMSSREWQKQRRDYVRQFTHVLIEAERPLFGRLQGGDAFAEARALRSGGIDVAMMCHGTDVRLPSRHRDGSRWSPFHDDPATARALEAVAQRNIAGLEDLGAPVFVSTPDLLDDVPSATWCPVVVEPQRWASASPLLERSRPLVVHVPSKSSVKGTQLVAPVLHRLADEGLIDFEYVEGVPAAKMPDIYGRADVVIDQFRIGSYGVAACEAMAAGRVVIGHVTHAVRERVRRSTGHELPVVEATPDTLGEVLTAVATEPDAFRQRAQRGPEFVSDVHDGRLAANVLRRFVFGSDA